MNIGTTIFSQVMEHLPLLEFRKCVQRYRGNYKIQTFSCLDPFLVMSFAQLSYRESLRDIEVCLRAMRSKLYHMGIRGGISRNNLAHANETRDWRIWADFAQVLIHTARHLYADDPFGVELDQTVYAFDSTTIDLKSFAFSVGQIPKTQGRRQTPHFDRSSRQHPFLYSDYRWKSPRRQCPRQSGPGTRIFLHSGSWLSRLQSSLPFASGPVLLCDSFQIESSIPKTLFSRDRQIHGSPLGPNRCPDNFLRRQVVSGKTSACPLLRSRKQQTLMLLDQQFFAASFDHCPTVQMPLAGGTVFQMDQTTSEDQSLLRYLRKCRENPSLDRRLSLHPGSHPEKAAWLRSRPLHNSTDFECDVIRENAHFTSLCRVSTRNSKL